MSIEPPPPSIVAEVVARALAEDRAFDDAATLGAIPADAAARGAFVAREAGVLAGMPVVAEVFRQLDARVRVVPHLGEGERFPAGTVLATAEGPARALLQGERTALNFLQRLSGIATLTRSFADAVAGTGCLILDTRKTTPGLRDLEKYAVRCGGGANHRRDLASMAMLKDNHRELLARAGVSMAEAVRRIRARTPGIGVEIEVDTLAELEEALAAEPDWVLLDNMAPAELREAVRRTAGRAKLEASGGVTLTTVRAIAETGVDAVSVGALTHGARALDIALDFEF
jgi:nicotinate-nucleotide pyrophosphorylase (carboxylating)